jgi:hypothetical protein
VTVAQTEFQLLVTNTPKDYQRFQTAYIWRRSGGFLKNAAAMIYLFLLGMVILPLSTAGRGLTEDLFGEMPPPLSLLWLAVVGGIPWILIYAKTVGWVLSRFWKSDLGSFTLPTSFSIGPEGVRAESENGHSFFRWRGIKEIVVSGDTFYLGLGGNVALVIPKRAFGSPDEAASFLSFAKHHIAAHEGTSGVFA